MWLRLQVRVAGYMTSSFLFWVSTWKRCGSVLRLSHSGTHSVVDSLVSPVSMWMGFHAVVLPSLLLTCPHQRKNKMMFPLCYNRGNSNFFHLVNSLPRVKNKSLMIWDSKHCWPCFILTVLSKSGKHCILQFDFSFSLGGKTNKLKFVMHADNWTGCQNVCVHYSWQERHQHAVSLSCAAFNPISFPSYNVAGFSQQCSKISPLWQQSGCSHLLRSAIDVQ